MFFKKYERKRGCVNKDDYVDNWSFSRKERKIGLKLVFEFSLYLLIWIDNYFKDT